MPWSAGNLKALAKKTAQLGRRLTGQERYARVLASSLSALGELVWAAQMTGFTFF